MIVLAMLSKMREQRNKSYARAAYGKAFLLFGTLLDPAKKKGIKHQDTMSGCYAQAEANRSQR